MMKWVVYLGIFLLLIMCSFWGYLFSYRVEFLQTALERSCPPYKVTIGAVEIQDSETVVIQDISIFTKEASPSLLTHIPNAAFSSSISSWLFWLCTPSSSPLHLKSMCINTRKSSPLTFQPTSVNFFLTADSCLIIGPDGKNHTLYGLNSSLASILWAIHQTSPHALCEEDRVR